MLDILSLIGGLVLILCGANWLTDGASAMAKRWGVSDLVIGLTVVAFGTSAPELVISVMSSINGNAGIAVGNVVGSNIFNILVIIGVVALVRPIMVERSLLANDIPLVVLSSVALMAIGLGPILGSASEATATRVDGILLLLFFLIFLRYTFSQALKGGNDGTEPATQEEKVGEEIKAMGMGKSILLVVAGLAALIFGGDIFVDGASGIARSFGVSDAVIGLTIVAMGTSLPELATSITAARKGNTGIAVGNVIGSCIFNVFMVLGVAATIRPLPFGQIGLVDLTTLMGASLLFWIFGRYYKTLTITRLEGSILVPGYVAYTIYLVLGAL
ncbi:MAG: calcium/sodium antiporter [Muribaculaceae bacterium]|nr:calcium/sodium antiporter [Muribaculaceae bacterium]